MSNLKDVLTTIVAIGMVIFGAVSAYLQTLTGDINWWQLIMLIAGAIVAYFTGKKANGGTKSASAIAENNKK